MPHETNLPAPAASSPTGKPLLQLDWEGILKLGGDYGWPERQMELALANTIRLMYLDQGMLAEVDVSIPDKAIAVRRRNGQGRTGHWVDIDKPLLPTVAHILATMQLIQYGDGAPGRVLEGTVSGYRDGGVLYRIKPDKTVLVPENLLSVVDSFKPPAFGTTQILALLAGVDSASGLRLATRRGREFIASVLEMYYPECVSGIWTGASNSWAVIRMKPEHVTAWLEKGGINLKTMQQILGLKRITLLPEGRGATPQECADNELKHFVNNAWKACRITEMTPERVTITTPLDDQDPKKLRTFTAMVQKIVTERDVKVV